MLLTSKLGSDLLGRAMAFNLTLCLTALFGILTTITNSFPVLCIVLFFLGTAVGVRAPCHMDRGPSLT
jgi:hypothetical protein